MNSPRVDRDSHVTALIRARQAAEADPGNAAAHFNQALALGQLGQWEQAIAAWERAVALEPDNAFAYVNIGIAYLEQAQWEQAEQAFTQAVRCRADHAAAHFGLGIARAQQGRHEAAKDAWEQTLRLAPDHAEARYNVDFLAATPRDRTDDAQIDAPAALAANMTCMAQVEYEVTSQISMLPIIENIENTIESNSIESDACKIDALPAAKSSTESRIKLPPVSGPSLDAIAQSVITAQHDALPEQAAASTTPTQTAETQTAEEQKPGQAGVEPTLRMDSKELKNEYRKLRRREASTNNSFNTLPNIGNKWANGKWMTGGAILLLALLLTLWGVWGLSKQPASVPPSGSSATSGLPVTSASLSYKSQSPIPPPPPSPPALSEHSSPVPTEEPHGATTAPLALSGTTPANTPLPSRAADIPASKPAKSTVKPESDPERSAVAANAAPAPTLGAHQAPRKRADAAKNSAERNSETPRKPRPAQAVRARPATATRHAGFHDEDTFSTYSHTEHKDNSEEWTDKIP